MNQYKVSINLLGAGVKYFLSISLCLTLAIIGVYIFSFSIPFYFYAAFIAFLLIMLLFFIQPFYAFITLLFLRPLLDPLSEYKIAASVNLLALFSLLFIGFLILILFNDQTKSWKPCISGYFYPYLLVSVFSCANLENYFDGLIFFTKLCSLLSIYLLAYHLVNNKHDGYIIFLTVALSSIIPIGYGMFQHFTDGGIQQGQTIETLRLNSTFVLSNPYGFFLCVVILVFIYLLFSKKGEKLFKLFSYGMLCLAFVSLLLTYTRTAWFSLGVGLIIYAVKEKKLRIYLLLLGILGAAILHQEIIERISDLFTPRRYGTNSWEFRINITRQLLENAFPKHYFLGFGIGSSEEVAAKYTQYSLPPHNDVIRVIIETGVLGLIFYSTFFFKNFTYYINKIRKYPERSYNLFMLVLLSVFIIISCGQNLFFFITTTGYLCCFLGVTQKLNDIDDINEKNHITV